MSKSKRTLNGQIIVGDEELAWRLHREPQWRTTDGWRGLVVAVNHVDGKREALVEWPMPKCKSHSVPYRQRPKIDAQVLKVGIKAALDAGWEPLSKGKPVAVLLE